VSAPTSDLPAAVLAHNVRSGSVSACDVVSAACARIDTVHAGRDGLNAVLWEDRPAALEAAAELDRGLAAGATLGALAGVPVMLKDNIATLGLPTSCGSRILEGYKSPYESTAAARLRQAGAIILAKTNCDEFAMGSSTEHSAFGPARNPWDPTRVPGGSSGGSAAAVAAGVVRVALGSETGGSVRQPASFCGVVGIKPTYGRVSRFGLVAFASSLDQIGVFGRTVDDAALGLHSIAGHDPLDSTSAEVPVDDYRAAASDSVRGMVIGKPREYFPESLSADVRDRCERALSALTALGAEIREVSLPSTEYAIPVYYIIAPAEASSNLARYDGVRYGRRISRPSLPEMYEATRSSGFGPEVTRRILLGTYVLSAGYYDAYYRKAMDVRALIAAELRNTFASGVDLLFTPTTPTPAFALGAKTADPYEMYLSDIFTVTANLAGIPAMSLPIGTIDGLPIGGQFLGPHFAERRMLAAAYALEQALGNGVAS
jgi:aspartyl-tRNA(Asn)/glutamyl-tRNA(Gln) amidotransferase subunit A